MLSRTARDTLHIARMFDPLTVRIEQEFADEVIGGAVVATRPLSAPENLHHAGRQGTCNPTSGPRRPNHGTVK